MAMAISSTWAEETAYKTQAFETPHGHTEVVKTGTLTREIRDDHKVCLEKEAGSHHGLLIATGWTLAVTKAPGCLTSFSWNGPGHLQHQPFWLQ